MSEQTRTEVVAQWATSRDAVPPGHTQITVYDESSGERVATVFSEDAVGPIAAAPDLLAALTMAVDQMAEWQEPTEFTQGNNVFCLALARAAIASASA